MERKDFIEKQFKKFVDCYKLQSTLCFNMPKDFESAFGIFDVVKNILYINISNELSFERIVYTFYHELRHALQYNYSKKFSKDIQKTLPYVIHYDGNCYMLKNNEWLHCKIDNEELNFVEIYKSFPYEIDANEFAYEQASLCVECNTGKGFERIYNDSKPNKKVGIDDIMKMCESIKMKCERM